MQILRAGVSNGTFAGCGCGKSPNLSTRICNIWADCSYIYMEISLGLFIRAKRKASHTEQKKTFRIQKQVCIFNGHVENESPILTWNFLIWISINPHVHSTWNSHVRLVLLAFHMETWGFPCGYWLIYSSWWSFHLKTIHFLYLWWTKERIKEPLAPHTGRAKVIGQLFGQSSNCYLWPSVFRSYGPI